MAKDSGTKRYDQITECRKFNLNVLHLCDNLMNILSKPITFQNERWPKIMGQNWKYIVHETSVYASM